jgi:hypothetical protein
MFGGARATLINAPRVLPVAPDTLPAEEILVRAAEEPPVAQSAVLLRAAEGDSRHRRKSCRRWLERSSTDAEHLLRVSQGVMKCR